MDTNDSERDRGVLSKSDRDYIRNPDEYNRQSAYERRKHIRERVYNAFLDGPLLLSLPADEREKIFDGWDEFADSVSPPEHEELDRPDHFSDPAPSLGQTVEKVKAELGFFSWFAFLYDGIDESDDFDFQSVLGESVRTAERNRGRVVTEFNFHVETRNQRDLEEIAERFKQSLKLTTEEIQRLRGEAAVSDAELGEYYDERASKSSVEDTEGSVYDLLK